MGAVAAAVRGLMGLFFRCLTGVRTLPMASSSSELSSSLDKGICVTFFGLRGFFGYQVVPSGEVYWFQNFHQAAEPDRDELKDIPSAEYRRMLLDMHREDHAPIAEIIR